MVESDTIHRKYAYLLQFHSFEVYCAACPRTFQNPRHHRMKPSQVRLRSKGSKRGHSPIPCKEIKRTTDIDNDCCAPAILLPIGNAFLGWEVAVNAFPARSGVHENVTDPHQKGLGLL